MVNVLTNLVQFLLGLPVLLAFLVAYGKLQPSALLLPLPILVQLVFTLGLALFVSALTVHFRDVQSILGHLRAPLVLRHPGALPLRGADRAAAHAPAPNPMSHLVVSYQQMLFHGHFDHWKGLGTSALVAVVVFALGAFFFDRLRDTLAEEV